MYYYQIRSQPPPQCKVSAVTGRGESGVLKEMTTSAPSKPCPKWSHLQTDPRAFLSAGHGNTESLRVGGPWGWVGVPARSGRFSGKPTSLRPRSAIFPAQRSPARTSGKAAGNGSTARSRFRLAAFQPSHYVGPHERSPQPSVGLGVGHLRIWGRFVLCC